MAQRSHLFVLGLALCLLFTISQVHARNFYLGVTFSGGGARAAIGTLAAYDALVPHLQGITVGDQNTVLSSVSGTSGGTWGITLHEEGRMVAKNSKKKAIDFMKAWTTKAKEEWGPNGDSGDAATARFNEDWKERVCYAIYAPFTSEQGSCQKSFAKSGQHDSIIKQMRSESNAIYLGVNAYKLSNHRDAGNNAAQLSGEDSQKPDYFLRFCPQTLQFDACDEVDCASPKRVSVYLAQTQTRLDAQASRIKDLKAEILRTSKQDKIKQLQAKIDSYDMREWLPIVASDRPNPLLEVLGFASSAYSSTQIPGALRATTIKGAIKFEGTTKMIPVVLADAGIFQNNPFGLLSERIIVSFDYSDIKKETKWETGFVTSSLKDLDVKTEAHGMPKTKAQEAMAKVATIMNAVNAVGPLPAPQVKAQAIAPADPEVAFLIHRVANPPKTFIQVPARFVDNALAYKDFPTIRLLATAVQYGTEKMDQYYSGLHKFYGTIKEKLQQAIAAEITAISQQQPQQQAQQQQQGQPQGQQQAAQQPAAAAAPAPPNL